MQWPEYFADTKSRLIIDGNFINQLKRLIIPEGTTIKLSVTLTTDLSHKCIVVDSRADRGQKVNQEGKNHVLVDSEGPRLKKYEQILQQKFCDKQKED